MDIDSRGTQSISFQYVINRGQTATRGDLGLDLNINHSKNEYTVTGIKPGGLVAERNKQLRESRSGQQELSILQLRVNDALQAVNGKSEHSAVCQELASALAIHMSVMRQGITGPGHGLPPTSEAIATTAPLVGGSDASDIESQYEALDGFQPGANHSLQAVPLEASYPSNMEASPVAAWGAKELQGEQLPEEYADEMYKGVAKTEVFGASPLPEGVSGNVEVSTTATVAHSSATPCAAPSTMTPAAVDWNSIRMAVVVEDYNPEGFEPESGYLTVARGDRVNLLTGTPGSVAAGTEGKERYPEYVYSAFEQSGSWDGDKREGWLPTAILQPESV